MNLLNLRMEPFIIPLSAFITVETAGSCWLTFKVYLRFNFFAKQMFPGPNSSISIASQFCHLGRFSQTNCQCSNQNLGHPLRQKCSTFIFIFKAGNRCFVAEFADIHRWLIYSGFFFPTWLAIWSFHRSLWRSHSCSKVPEIAVLYQLIALVYSIWKWRRRRTDYWDIINDHVS